MFVDAKNDFSVAQTIATAASTNVVDLGPIKGAARDVGVGEQFYIVLWTPTAMSGTTPTLTVAVQTDDNVGFASPTTLHTSAALTPANLAAGPVVIPMPFGSEKFLRLSYTAGGTVAAGTVSASVTLDPQKFVANARNYTV